MIITTIVLTVIQFIIYGIIWLVRYDEATTYAYGSSKKDFKEFSNKYKWWYFTIPFYFIFLGIKSLYNLIKNIREKTKNLLKEDEGTPLPAWSRRIPPPTIFDSHRSTQRILDDMLEDNNRVGGKSLGDILDDMVEKKEIEE